MNNDFETNYLSQTNSNENENHDNQNSINLNGVDSEVGHHSFTATQIQQFKEFSEQGDVYNRLVNSFAPSIWEMEDVKKGVLCQLFGGTSKRLQVILLFLLMLIIAELIISKLG